MDTEHRKKIENRLTPLQLYKLTPRTNCRECGFATCLAFSTQVIVGQASLDACPYMDRSLLEPIRAQLAEQHEAGIGVSRESFEKTLDFLRLELEKWDFEKIRESLGARLIQKDEGPGLSIPYFKQTIAITRKDVEDESGAEVTPWEKILICNYVIGGAVEPSGSWVGMESLPNSVSKIKSLKSHCENPLAEHFAGRISELPSVVEQIGKPIDLSEEKVDFAAEFRVFPKLIIRVLWWDTDPSEGFQCRTKFLFDSRVLQTIDLESLVFASERITDHLLGRANHHH